MSQASEQEIRGQIYEHFAQIGKALGSASRLELLELLAQSEYTVESLAQEAGLSVANTSQHLKKLRNARLVAVRREGVVAYYSLADEAVFDVWHKLRQLGEGRIVEIAWLANQLLPDRHSEATLTCGELLNLLDEEGVTILDVRPKIEYQAGHIRGACSIPFEELDSRYQELNLNHPIVVYGRGPYSTLAYHAVQFLRAKGLSARRLVSGLPEWRANGFPIAASSPAAQPPI
ncbi:MAG: metalloregulator ArsR/SmtB family transcription factor [Candidatus Promineifilaceae bacterium]|nr:metalloregulator ArsR/SmtB family transcription factor [Candidatus Promineifilaceae bacterium]